MNYIKYYFDICLNIATIKCRVVSTIKIGELTSKIYKRYCFSQLTGLARIPHLTKDFPAYCKRETHGSNISCASKNLQTFTEMLSNRIKL